MRRRRHTLEFRRDTDGWRWRYVASNGNILAHSGESYRRRIDCIRAAGVVVDVDCLSLYGDTEVIFSRYRPLRIEVAK